VIFADTSSPEQLAAALAAEVGDVIVVELYSESLGPPGSAGATYLDMLGTNAARIAAALAG
jgi:zinc/manganese transport system substrate-binding protein